MTDITDIFVDDSQDTLDATQGVTLQPAQGANEGPMQEPLNATTHQQYISSGLKIREIWSDLMLIVPYPHVRLT